ncbi:hypothetical protein K2E96_19245 [Pseudomonas sp. ERGC3:05]|nr:hypothetical protein [Pseudomonas sp. ERGC3:01]QZC97252.1 hypothetical protein K2E96_19245 [Pseudomonas sp. ERGC3:05]
MKVLVLLSALNKNTNGRQDFVPLVAAAAGVMGVLAGALVTTTATPENQARLRDAANALVDAAAQSGRPLKDQLTISAELWKFLYDTSFPADLLNDKNRALVNPILEGQGPHPTSDGYGAGGQPSTLTNTGGSQVVDPKGTDYSNPLVDLPSSGNMYNSDGAKGISITIEPKIADQMGKRGWTESSIQSVIDKPVKTVVTKDTRFDTVSGSRLNDPATGYIAKDGSYVVRNDRTGAIVQVSNKKDPEWVAPWD